MPFVVTFYSDEFTSLIPTFSDHFWRHLNVIWCDVRQSLFPGDCVVLKRRQRKCRHQTTFTRHCFSDVFDNVSSSICLRQHLIQFFTSCETKDEKLLFDPCYIGHIQCDQTMELKIAKVNPKVSPIEAAGVFTLILMFSNKPKESPEIWATFARKLVTRTFKMAQSCHTWHILHTADGSSRVSIYFSSKSPEETFPGILSVDASARSRLNFLILTFSSSLRELVSRTDFSRQNWTWRRSHKRGGCSLEAATVYSTGLSWSKMSTEVGKRPNLVSL